MKDYYLKSKLNPLKINNKDERTLYKIKILHYFKYNILIEII